MRRCATARTASGRPWSASGARWNERAIAATIAAAPARRLPTSARFARPASVLGEGDPQDGLEADQEEDGRRARGAEAQPEGEREAAQAAEEREQVQEPRRELRPEQGQAGDRVEPEPTRRESQPVLQQSRQHRQGQDQRLEGR